MILNADLNRLNNTDHQFTVNIFAHKLNLVYTILYLFMRY